MTMSERQKMAAGDWYTCIDPELANLRGRARAAVHQHNTMVPEDRGNAGPLLLDLISSQVGEMYIEAPFHCSYGFNIRIGRGVYINAGCVILDTGPVSIGASTMLGPGVHIYCAEHHQDLEQRKAGLEIARPMRIGANAWIGGRAVILAGVTVGDGAIVGAGAVVTRDVAAGAAVVGNPAKPMKPR